MMMGQLVTQIGKKMNWVVITEKSILDALNS